MKKYLLLFVLGCLSLLARPTVLQAALADSTVIEGFIEGLPPGTIKLVGCIGDQNYIADTTIVDAGGHFILRRSTALPAGYYYFLMSNGKNFSILIDKDEQFVTLRANVKDFAGTMQVNGSLNTDLLYQNFRFQFKQEPEFNALAEQFKKYPQGSPEFTAAKTRQDQLVAERKAALEATYKQYPNSFFTKFKIAGQNPDFVEFRKPNGSIDTMRQVISYRNRFWDGVDFADDRLLRTPVIANKLRRYIKELTPQHPDSLIKVADPLIRRVMPHRPYFQYFSNWIALQYENTKSTVMDGEAVYVHIVKNFFTPELATWDTPENLEKLQKHAWEMEASLLGKKGPDVRARNQYGIEMGLYDLKAPIVVVFMFSPDCEHCQKDAPAIQHLYERWKGKGVEFFGIGVNTTEGEWKPFLEKNGFTFTNVFDPTNRAIYAKYFVDITPELYVLNKDRIIVAKNLHAEQLEEVFQRELRKLK